MFGLGETVCFYDFDRNRNSMIYKQKNCILLHTILEILIKKCHKTLSLTKST